MLSCKIDRLHSFLERQFTSRLHPPKRSVCKFPATFTHHQFLLVRIAQPETWIMKSSYDFLRHCIRHSTSLYKISSHNVRDSEDLILHGRRIKYIHICRDVILHKSVKNTQLTTSKIVLFHSENNRNEYRICRIDAHILIAMKKNHFLITQGELSIVTTTLLCYGKRFELHQNESSFHAN